MSNLYEDISSTVLRRMKEGGFNFAQIHPIEFYAVFSEQDRAQRAAQNFRGETINTQVFPREDGSWNLQVSKVM